MFTQLKTILYAKNQKGTDFGTALALLKEDKFVDIVSGTVRKSVFLKKVKLISGVVVHLGSSIRECPRSYRQKRGRNSRANFAPNLAFFF